MRKVIIGNWKMHGDRTMAAALAKALAAQKIPPDVMVVLCPPATLIVQTAWMLKDTAIALGGQDCHSEPSGAFTGDISAGLLKDAGCRYVIVGHSERRLKHHETNATVKAKAAAALTAGLTPVICIGESEAERASGKAEEVVLEQLRQSIPDAGTEQFLLAYEPVWAIGSGRTSTAGEIARMHALIASAAGTKSPMLYGGSVSAGNAAEIMATQGVGGILVGGASLKAEEFCNIIKAAG